MKFSTSPSLFFIFLSVYFGLLTAFSLKAQQKSDSTTFYGKILLNPVKESDVASALSYFENGYKQDLRVRDTIQAIKKLRYIVIGQIEMGALHDSEETAIRALNLLDKLPPDSTVIEAKKALYNDLGRVYRTLKNPENAFRLYDESLKYCLNAQDSMVVLNNKGNLYNDLGNYRLAERQFQSVYEISLRSTDSLIKARALDNLGFSQSKLRQPEGLNNMLQALEIRVQANNLVGMYSSYAHLAKYYHDRLEEKKALDYAQKAYKIAHHINSPSYIENSLVNLLEIRKDSLSREYIKLNDSLQQAKLQKQNKYAGMQYNLAKEKKKTEANRLLKEKEKRKRQLYQFLGILLFFAIVSVYFIQRSQNRKNTIREIFNTEARISKKVHDEVANDIYHLMVKTQLSVPDSDFLLDDLELIYRKTRDISRENTALTIQDDFGAQLNDLLQSYQQEDTVITILNISKINWNAISNIKKTTIYRILQELMTNMKKHSQASQVLVSFEKSGNTLQIKYVDNGVGCHLKNKNGLENTENRIKAIKGRIIFVTEPHKGFKVTLTL